MSGNTKEDLEDFGLDEDLLRGESLEDLDDLIVARVSQSDHRFVPTISSKIVRIDSINLRFESKEVRDELYESILSHGLIPKEYEGTGRAYCGDTIIRNTGDSCYLLCFHGEMVNEIFFFLCSKADRGLMKKAIWTRLDLRYGLETNYKKEVIERLEEFVAANRSKKGVKHEFDWIRSDRRVTINGRTKELFGRLYNSFGSKKANRLREETVFEFEFKKKLQGIQSYFEEDLSEEMILRKIRQLVLKKFFDFFSPLEETEILKIFVPLFEETQKYSVHLEKELDSKNPFLLAAVDVRNLKTNEIPLFSSNILDSLRLEMDEVKKDKLFASIWLFWEEFFVSAKKKVESMNGFDGLGKESYWELEMNLSSFCKLTSIKRDKQSEKKILALVDYLSGLKIKSFLEEKVEYFVLFPRFTVDFKKRKVKFLFHPIVLRSDFWETTTSATFFHDYVENFSSFREKVYRSYAISPYLLVLFSLSKDQESVTKKDIALPAKLKDDKVLPYILDVVNNHLKELNMSLEYNSSKKCIEKKGKEKEKKESDF